MRLKRILLILVIVAIAGPVLIAIGVACFLIIAAVGGIGIGAGESITNIIAHSQIHTPATGPQWSPDGSRIVFESQKQIYLIDANGTQLQSISEDLGEFDFDAAPSISPDGTHIVYTAVRHESTFTGWTRKPEIVTSAIDGSRKREVLAGTEGDTASVWSPKGDRIAYISYGPIYTMARDGTDVRQIVTSVTRYIADISLPPVWSPDGKFMAFAARDPIDRYTYVVSVVGADGSNLKELRETASWYASGPYADDGREVSVPINLPAWSPDGRRLAFAKFEGDTVKVYTIEADGSNPREVFAVADLGIRLSVDFWHGNLSWAPDGSEILLGNVGGVWSEGSLLPLRNVLIRSDGAGFRELPGPGGYASWSPDGARIAVRPLTSDDPENDSGIELYTVASDLSAAWVLVSREFEKEWKQGKYYKRWILAAAGGVPLNDFPETQP